MWSEHCSYKSSRVHLKRLPTRSKRVLQGPGENVALSTSAMEGCAQIESHTTRVHRTISRRNQAGGILRDIFTMAQDRSR